MRSRTRLVFLLCLALLMGTLPSQAQGFEVKTHQLKNGMKVLVQEDSTIPNVAFYIFYRIGSRNERPGATGRSARDT